jgi:hypothetical protein
MIFCLHWFFSAAVQQVMKMEFPVLIYLWLIKILFQLPSGLVVGLVNTHTQ